MILTGPKIKEEIKSGNIIIDPYDSKCVNPNSYNYKLGSSLKVFEKFEDNIHHFKEVSIEENGFVLEPQQMYLGHTYETIGSKEYAMSLIGRSSIGRLGLFLQVSANLGHTGSAHQWTLELMATKKIIIYPLMKIGQVSFWKNQGRVNFYQGYYNQFNKPTEARSDK